MRNHIPCQAILAVTATATPAVAASISASLGIKAADVITEATMPANLHLSVTHLPTGD